MERTNAGQHRLFSNTPFSKYAVFATLPTDHEVFLAICLALKLHKAGRMAGVRRYEDLIAWQLADAFKREVYRLLETRLVAASWKLREQLADAAGAVPKDISEGFIRYSPAQFVRFLDYGLASLREAEQWLKDAVCRKFLTPEEARDGLLLAKRCWKAALELKHSQERELRRRRARRQKGDGAHEQ